jgi:hypothetical protein
MAQYSKIDSGRTGQLASVRETGEALKVARWDLWAAEPLSQRQQPAIEAVIFEDRLGGYLVRVQQVLARKAPRGCPGAACADAPGGPVFASFTTLDEADAFVSERAGRGGK